MKQNDILLQHMQEEHVPQIAQLEQLCFGDPWSDASIRSELINPLSLWIVALDRERVVGYIGSQTVLGEADIMNIAVHPDYRRNGIAKRLLEQLREELHQTRDVYSLTLEVRVSNVEAISLYMLMGYREVGRRHGYYRNPKEDALILRKEWEL